MGFLAARSPGGAVKVGARFKQVVEMISEQPLGSQEVVNRRGVRRAPLVTYPYVVYYRVMTNEIEILRIRHGARRQWEQWPD